MEVIYSYFTHTGTVKNTNQDSLLIEKGTIGEALFHLFVVCDGMGGLQKGEVASAELIRAFSEWFREELPDIWEEKDSEFRATALEVSLRRILDRENKKIAQYGRKQRIQLGSTVSAMLVVNGVYYIIHVGDTRIYQISSQVTQLTQDHSLVAQEIAQGRMREEDAELDSRRNVLLQCIGASEHIEPQFLTGFILTNAIYLLCSDGFRHEMNASEMIEYFDPIKMDSTQKIFESCEKLTYAVMNRGEQDNISVVAFRQV